MLVKSEQSAAAILVGQVLRAIVDHSLNHGNRSRVQRRLRPSQLPHRRLHFWDLRNGRVLLLQDVEYFADGGVRHSRRHPQERSFVEGRHKLLAQPRQGLGEGRKGGRMAQCGWHKAEDAGKTQPRGRARQRQQQGKKQGQALVIQTPPEHAGEYMLQGAKKRQQAADQSSGEDKIAPSALFRAKGQPVFR